MRELLRFWTAGGEAGILGVEDGTDLAADTLEKLMVCRDDGQSDWKEGPDAWGHYARYKGVAYTLYPTTTLELIGQAITRPSFTFREDIEPGLYERAKNAWHKALKAKTDEIDAQLAAEEDAQALKIKEAKAIFDGSSYGFTANKKITITVPVTYHDGSKGTKTIHAFEILLDRKATGLILQRPLYADHSGTTWWQVAHKTSGMIVSGELRLKSRSQALKYAGALHAADPFAWLGTDLDHLLEVGKAIYEAAKVYFSLP